jgi:hypothetical protein
MPVSGLSLDAMNILQAFIKLLLPSWVPRRKSHDSPYKNLGATLLSLLQNTKPKFSPGNSLFAPLTLFSPRLDGILGMPSVQNDDLIHKFLEPLSQGPEVGPEPGGGGASDSNISSCQGYLYVLTGIDDWKTVLWKKKHWYAFKYGSLFKYKAKGVCCLKKEPNLTGK